MPLTTRRALTAAGLAACALALLAPGTGRWRVFAEGSTPIDSKVRKSDVPHFLNGYDDWKGGFLDTADAGPAGGLYEVSTSDCGVGQGSPGTGK